MILSIGKYSIRITVWSQIVIVIIVLFLGRQKHPFNSRMTKNYWMKVFFWNPVIIITSIFPFRRTNSKNLNFPTFEYTSNRRTSLKKVQVFFNTTTKKQYYTKTNNRERERNSEGIHRNLCKAINIHLNSDYKARKHYELWKMNGVKIWGREWSEWLVSSKSAFLCNDFVQFIHDWFNQ